ncbi:sulfurtransferase [Niallia sp. XMNu-256]|uniref:sulfurtransferase n=1 Tax=Niallia sp. XMNu-256 TaxID=3082444 RepID=UPI0030CB626A
MIPIFVSTEWLVDRLDDPNLRIIDATTFLGPPLHEAYMDVSSGREAYEKNHIKGAVFADLYEDFSETESELSFTHPSREKFIKNIRDLGVGEETYVVVYDQGITDDAIVAVSYWASRFAWQLRYEGFDRVAVLDGGFIKWLEERRPTTSQLNSYPQGNFAGVRRPELFVTKEDVLQSLDDEDIIIVDSLPRESYNGDPNSLERSGHIPGSVNIFFGIQSNSKTKETSPDGDIQEIFEKAGVLDPDKKVIIYCGFAVAATWVALLLNKLGQNNVAVYDGSMEEWASNLSLPLEVNFKN